MSRGARAFVAIVFTLLGIAFVLPLASLVREQGLETGLALAAFDSNHFIFFPLFGILALFAFYVPSAIFTDMYWTGKIWAGRWRFLLGFIVVAVASIAITQVMLKAGPRTAWELAPEVLAKDRGEPPNCAMSNGACRRAPVLGAVLDLRQASGTRVGLSKFVRNCTPDPLLELTEELKASRYCFVTRSRVDARTCCQAQAAYGKAVSRLFEREKRSETYLVHAAVLPLKIFFLLIVLVIGVMLVVWRNKVDAFYAPYVKRLERGILVGAMAMLFWPLSYHSNLLAYGALYGWPADGADTAGLAISGLTLPVGDALRRYAALAFSLALGPWALLILFFFFHRKGMETVARVAGVMASFVAVLRYEQIVDFGTRFIGAGSAALELGFLAAIAAVGLFLLVVPSRSSSDDGAAERG